MRSKTVPATIDDGVLISPSLIPNAGMGLFAQRAFRKGEYITLYDGEVLTREEANKRPCHTHMAAREGTIVDGLKTPVRGKGGGSFANGTLFEKESNAIIVCQLASLFVKAKRNIKSGEEILVCYGRRGFLRAMPSTHLP
jgi:SET domain-containing protein